MSAIEMDVWNKKKRKLNSDEAGTLLKGKNGAEMENYQVLTTKNPKTAMDPQFVVFPWFNELPQEIIIMIFQCADFFTQQKIHRVCQYWKYLLTIPELMQDVHLDTSSLLDNGKFKSEMQRKRSAWTFSNSTANALTFNGRYSKRTNFHADVSQLLKKFLKRFPDHTVLHLRCLPPMTMTDASEWDWWVGETRHIITISQSTLSDHTLCIPGAAVQASFTEALEVNLICDIPYLVLNPKQYYSIYDQCGWPYPTDQLAWLLKCVVQLAADARWLHWLQSQEFQDIYENVPDNLEEILGDVAASSENDNFEGSLELWDWLDGAERGAPLLMAAYILSRDDIDLPRPPHKFRFETDEFYRTVRGPVYSQ